MNIDVFKDKAIAASDLLKIMGSERRLMILCQLGRGEKSVGELEKLIGLPCKFTLCLFVIPEGMMAGS